MDTEIFEFFDGIEVSPVHPGRTLATEFAALVEREVEAA